MVAVLSLCTTAMLKSVNPQPEVIPTLAPIVVTHPKVSRPQVRGDVAAFMNAIGHAESGQRLDVVNQNDCMGKYQFCQSTFRFLKEQNIIDSTITREQFLTDETIQDAAMVALMRYNYKRLRPLIRIYSGKWHNGIFVTTSGLLAAAHLVGVGGVNAYFNPEEDTGRYVTVDANGTTVQHYLSRFANYQIRL